MDDDDLRRGRPTCHKAYDEATAILVGDALQPLAFQLLARDPALPAAPAIRLRLVELLSEASGTSGMAGGQAIDLEVQGRQLDIAQVEDMHARKTGAVIRASVLMAAECAPQLAPHLYAALERFAAAIGLAFQIQDDLLDVIGDASTLGKATGADREHAKPTHPAVIGIAASQERVQSAAQPGARGPHALRRTRGAAAFAGSLAVVAALLTAAAANEKLPLSVVGNALTALRDLPEFGTQEGRYAAPCDQPRAAHARIDRSRRGRFAQQRRQRTADRAPCPREPRRVAAVGERAFEPHAPAGQLRRAARAGRGAQADDVPPAARQGAVSVSAAKNGARRAARAGHRALSSGPKL